MIPTWNMSSYFMGGTVRLRSPPRKRARRSMWGLCGPRLARRCIRLVTVVQAGTAGTPVSEARGAGRVKGAVALWMRGYWPNRVLM